MCNCCSQDFYFLFLSAKNLLKKNLTNGTSSWERGEGTLMVKEIKNTGWIKAQKTPIGLGKKTPKGLAQKVHTTKSQAQTQKTLSQQDQRRTTTTHAATSHLRNHQEEQKAPPETCKQTTSRWHIIDYRRIVSLIQWRSTLNTFWYSCLIKYGILSRNIQKSIKKICTMSVNSIISFIVSI